MPKDSLGVSPTGKKTMALLVLVLILNLSWSLFAKVSVTDPLLWLVSFFLFPIIFLALTYYKKKVVYIFDAVYSIGYILFSANVVLNLTQLPCCFVEAGFISPISAIIGATLLVFSLKGFAKS